MDGTLVFAAQYRDSAGTPHSCFIFSGDGGGTWTVSAPAIAAGNPDAAPTSESQIAQLPDGSLLISMRNEAKTGKRAWAVYRWKDGLPDGQWGDPWFRVADPTCMASLVRHQAGLLLFSNPNSAKARVALTVRASVDGGMVWTDGRVIEPGPSGYSCMTILGDGSIGILYETGRNTELETLTFTRFTLDWLLSP
jgi:sialidase-1